MATSKLEMFVGVAQKPQHLGAADRSEYREAAGAVAQSFQTTFGNCHRTYGSSIRWGRELRETEIFCQNGNAHAVIRLSQFSDFIREITVDLALKKERALTKTVAALVR